MAVAEGTFGEHIAVSSHSGTGTVDIVFDNRHQCVEMYVKSSAAATIEVKMLPPGVGGVTFSTLLDPPAGATTVTHAGAGESVVFFQTPVSGVRLNPTTNTGNIDVVIRYAGRAA
jgi:hypothetical protein|tara:strand:- start:657 stop:1001 length:345 start_codon:yes stop_codon:yes gene_type:complete